jgi:hypothetical protein
MTTKSVSISKVKSRRGKALAQAPEVAQHLLWDAAASSVPPALKVVMSAAAVVVVPTPAGPKPAAQAAAQ